MFQLLMNFYLESSQICSLIVCYILHYLETPLLKKNNIGKIGHVSGQYPGHLLDMLQILGMSNEAYQFNDLWSFSTLIVNNNVFAWCSCLLAVCTTEGHVRLYRMPFLEFSAEWVEVWIKDVQQYIHNFLVLYLFLFVGVPQMYRQERCHCLRFQYSNWINYINLNGKNHNWRYGRVYNFLSSGAVRLRRIMWIENVQHMTRLMLWRTIKFFILKTK